MKILKDKILILLLITSLGLVYLMMSRGVWETSIEQQGAGAKNRIELSDNLSIESEYFIHTGSQTLGSHTYFVVANSCFSIDSLAIQIVENNKGERKQLKIVETRIADVQQLEFDSVGMIIPESLLQTYKVSVCPGQQIGITNRFKYTGPESEDFDINYFIKAEEQEPIRVTARLKRVENFRIVGRNHYDFIILLYPLLWLTFGILVLSKVVLVVRKKRKPNKTYSA